MTRYKTIFTTERGQRHQEAARRAAPDYLDITMLRQPDRATLRSFLAEADYLISERTGTIDGDMIRAAPNLKLILRLGSLTYDIDTAAARQAGVAVCYWPVGSVIRVAEHLVLQLLALSKTPLLITGRAGRGSTACGTRPSVLSALARLGRNWLAGWLAGTAPCSITNGGVCPHRLKPS
jgi:phosphoglycerate dehydrogenase-like enzyme